MRTVKLFSIITLSCLIFTGCGVKNIFRDPNAQYQLKAVKDSKMAEETYYVKQTTEFYQTFSIDKNGTVSSGSSTQIADANRMIWTSKNNSLIPTMYQDGVIAYSSQKNIKMEKATLERYAYAGASLGLYGAEYTDDGEIKFDANKMVEDSDIAKQLKGEKANSFTITEVNGKRLTKKRLSDGGIINGLKYGQTYKLNLYSGTFYKTIRVKADRKFYRSLEVYSTTDISTTKNGYLSIRMPEEAVSGYYLVNGTGFFRYYNVTKDKVTKKINLNKPHYKNLLDQIKGYSQQYVVSVASALQDVEFFANYDPKQVTNDSEIVAVLSSPDKKTYKMGVANGVISTVLSYAVPGRWTINIIPQTLKISEVSAKSSAQEDTATEETYTYTMQESTNQKISAIYTGDGNVWGNVTAPDGTVYPMQLGSTYADGQRVNAISVTIPYVAAGDYVIHIYHNADTSIQDPLVSNDDSTSSDINITVNSGDSSGGSPQSGAVSESGLNGDYTEGEDIDEGDDTSDDE